MWRYWNSEEKVGCVALVLGIAIGMGVLIWVATWR
jgi:hypothetical protein